MKIEYYGHSCFKIYNSDYSIAFDPYDNSIGLGILNLKANELFVSHEHFDHNYRAGVKLEVKQYSKIESKKIHSWHDKENGKLRGENYIHLVEFDGIRFCHLGDLGDSLNEDQLNQIGKVDVLMIPIGGKYTIDSKEALHVIKQINPQVIIPMHYNLDTCNIELDKLEKFINETNKEINVVMNESSLLEYNNSLSGIYVLQIKEDKNDL